jgi:hypothetical protein
VIGRAAGVDRRDRRLEHNRAIDEASRFTPSEYAMSSPWKAVTILGAIVVAAAAAAVVVLVVVNALHANTIRR